MSIASGDSPVIRMSGKSSDLPRLLLGEIGYRCVSSWLPKQRWFAGKSKKIAGGAFSEVFRLGGGDQSFYFGGFLELRYETGGEESYFFPLSFSRDAQKTLSPLSVLVFDDVSGALEDALLIPEFGRSLLNLFCGEIGDIPVCVEKTPIFGDFSDSIDHNVLPRVLSGEQSNTSLLFDRSLIMKCYRRPEKGGNCDFEMGKFFASRGSSLPVAPLLGAIGHAREEGDSTLLALLSGYVQNKGDAWSWLLKEIDPETIRKNDLDRRDRLLGGTVSDLVGKIGASTGVMHRSLSEGVFPPEMAPVDFRREDWDDLERSVSAILSEIFPERGGSPPSWWPEAIPFEETVALFDERIPSLFASSFPAASSGSLGMKIRCHGDFHLGQLLVTDALDIVVIDFEGEPSVPISVRREKRTPLSDVAGMLRSFDYLSKMIFPDAVDRKVSKALLSEISQIFLREYKEKMSGATVLPSGPGFAILLEACLVRKAFYELSYEINNRPGWSVVPLEGILEIL